MGVKRASNLSDCIHRTVQQGTGDPESRVVTTYGYAVCAMRVPRKYAGKLVWDWRLAALTMMVLCAPAANAADKQPVPWARISLQKLGFPGVSPGFVTAGASVLTVNFVDDDHLLVTFGMRGLVKRIAGDPDTDEDREVAAEIVDVPSGKIVARTEWGLADH